MDADWKCLEYEFRQALASASNVLTQDIVDASRAFGDNSRAESFLREKLNWGFLSAPEGLMSSAAHAINVFCSKMDEGTPDHIREHVVDHVAVVEVGIQKRELTLDFVRSWGVIHHAAGVLDALTCNDSAEKKLLQGYNASQKNSLTLQRYWYAWCQKDYGLLEGAARKELDDELADMCESIRTGKQHAPMFNAAWFGKMLQRAGDDGPQLTTTFTRMSREEIIRMTANRLIGRDELPPFVRQLHPGF